MTKEEIIKIVLADERAKKWIGTATPIEHSSRAEQQGMAAGFAAGEVLASPMAWGTRDLMGMIFPASPEPAK